MRTSKNGFAIAQTAVHGKKQHRINGKFAKMPAPKRGRPFGKIEAKFVVVANYKGERFELAASSYLAHATKRCSKIQSIVKHFRGTFEVLRDPTDPLKPVGELFSTVSPTLVAKLAAALR